MHIEMQSLWWHAHAEEGFRGKLTDVSHGVDSKEDAEELRKQQRIFGCTAKLHHGKYQVCHRTDSVILLLALPIPLSIPLPIPLPILPRMPLL